RSSGFSSLLPNREQYSKKTKGGKGKIGEKTRLVLFLFIFPSDKRKYNRGNKTKEGLLDATHEI
ncbi:MAG: hypothetical protein II797_05860, partial [Clostridia bacterium]|nr:hypothetical protein [Clostridia bacterium]